MNASASATAVERRIAIAADPLEQLRRMIEIRFLEDGLNALYTEGKIRGSIHTCQGQEAVAVAAASVSRPADHACATYRGHGAALAFGVTPLAVAAEVLGRQAGSVGGLGGSMHLADPSVNFLPTMAIVGAGLPIATGAAWASQYLGNEGVSFVFFGDGSANIGAFHESLNLAAVWRLPVIFVCENNLYGEYSPLSTTTASADIAVRAEAYGIPATVADGQDLVSLKEIFGSAVAAARAGGGPRFIEAKTYRYHGHSRSDPGAYRDPDEVARWKQRDPIRIYSDVLLQRGLITDADAAEMTAEVQSAVTRALEEAQSSPPPERDALFAHVTGD